jgi:hypothetical protein
LEDRFSALEDGFSMLEGRFCIFWRAGLDTETSSLFLAILSTLNEGIYILEEIFHFLEIKILEGFKDNLHLK